MWGVRPIGALCKKHKESLSEDVFYNYKRGHPKINNYNEAIFNETLVYLEDQVLKLGGTDLPHFGLPQPDKSAVTRVPLPLARETTYDVFEQAEYAAENEPSLNEEQRSVLEEVMSSINEGKGSFYFLDSPGGTGKTFLLKLILAEVRANQDVAVAVASSRNRLNPTAQWKNGLLHIQTPDWSGQ